MFFGNVKFKKSLVFALLFCALSNPVFSQQGKAFKVRYQGNVNGEMTMIANNIVNRVEGGEGPNSPYDEVSNIGKINDEFDMDYIDVDSDKSTFSSSSATLSLDNPSSKKIVYAGLYWTATYTCASSKLMKRSRFEVTDVNRESFDEVKIKLPNQNDYTSIKGELIFDGYRNPDFKESAPYVLYKDITSLVKSIENPFGTYTVANIKSTLGRISGGVSAGWTLFFVYEDATMKSKSISTYDGFVGITEKSLDITFSGFKTVAEGSVNAKIACSALEGDVKLKGDQILIRDSRTENFTQLSNTLHNRINVFNSSITINDGRFTDRKPNSANTLGFDAFIMTIDNANNAVIGNNTEEAVVRLKTSGDRFFMFFSAFEVENIKPTEAIEVDDKKVIASAIAEQKKDAKLAKEKELEKDTELVKQLIVEQEKKDASLIAKEKELAIQQETAKVQKELEKERELAIQKETAKVQKELELKKERELAVQKETAIINKEKNIEKERELAIQKETARVQKELELKKERELAIQKEQDLKTTKEKYLAIQQETAKAQKEKDKKIVTTQQKEVATNIEKEKTKELALQQEASKVKNELEKEVAKVEKEKIKEEPKQKDLTNSINEDEIANSESTIYVKENKSRKQIKKEAIENDLNNLNGVPRKKHDKNKFKNTPRIEPIESASVAINGGKKGYYIIANVFAIKANAKRFKKTLRKMGIRANYFYNSANKYRYVYTSRHLTFEEANILYYSNLNGMYFDDLWIMTVNLDK